MDSLSRVEVPTTCAEGTPMEPPNSALRTSGDEVRPGRSGLVKSGIGARYHGRRVSLAAGVKRFQN